MLLLGKSIFSYVNSAIFPDHKYEAKLPRGWKHSLLPSINYSHRYKPAPHPNVDWQAERTKSGLTAALDHACVHACVQGGMFQKLINLPLKNKPPKYLE